VMIKKGQLVATSRKMRILWTETEQMWFSLEIQKHFACFAVISLCIICFLERTRPFPEYEAFYDPNQLTLPAFFFISWNTDSLKALLISVYSDRIDI
jgi:hypothetical protein